MDKFGKEFSVVLTIIPKVLQMFLNFCLVLLAFILSFLLIKELTVFFKILVTVGAGDYQQFLANILIFFLYFEFITMIVKYFKEDYHFPLRYFLYVGITAMIRLIIVEHDHPIDTLIYSLVILILIVGYFIMNITPLERPNRHYFFKRSKE
ncbi:phosphate-starvation-inducible protein PsiE [Psychrobacillus sp. NPDC096623]|uniref:phosphate-starvation-inducible protein PsiE n=1 Tax=Psychrobacillus sp. NPDC096623 TaxID=3364492 RepID=UPI0037F6A573